MNKYILDSIRNKSRCVLKDLTKPQSKAISEIIHGLFLKGTPILRHLVQDKTKLTKKQAEKFSHHLGNIKLSKKVDEYAIKQALNNIGQKTIIAYDLTDINKEASKKIEKISRVFDGSKRKVTNGFVLHGVGINNILVKFEIHDKEANTQNQTREKIIEELTKKLKGKGIWVFDRGNDDKAFFKKLRQKPGLHFMARLKSDRQVVIKETGDIIQVKNLKPGKYRVYLMSRFNNKVEKEYEYMLVISNHLDDEHQPIRLISNLNYKRTTKKQLVQMYLERWGIENQFKQIKNSFNAEKIRVLSYKKFSNLIALMQLAMIISHLLFISLQKANTFFIAEVLGVYKQFTRMKTLTVNICSFISFMRAHLKACIKRQTPQNRPNPPNQASLFPI